MAIHRGIQSAIFYYLSCAPCAEARYRKKRKQEAVWDRAAREALEADLPNAYRHPSPSSTNPHWQTEIALGPTGVGRGKKKANAASDPRRGRKKINTGLNADTSGSPSEIDLPHHERDGDRWNYRPYQRDDEELWGSLNNLDGMLQDLQIPERARTRDSTSSKPYHPSRNPPISDLHPATVTKVSSREEVMWMMQPPPVAEVMSGKERASRSRSDSGGSRMSPAMSATLSRQVSARLLERRIRAGEVSAAGMSRESSSRTSHNNPTATQLSFSSISERDFALSPVASARELPYREHSEESYQTVLHHQHQRIPQPHRVASRPQLSTITSSTEIPQTAAGGTLPRSSSSTKTSLDRMPTPTDLPELVNENTLSTPPQSRDSTLLALQSQPPHDDDDCIIPPPPSLLPHRHSASFLIKTGKEMHLLRRTELSSPAAHSHQQQVPTTAAVAGDEDEEDAILAAALEDLDSHHHLSNPKAVTPSSDLFHSWYTPDFELGTWVLEHTKRDGVRERWSMEF